MNHKKGLLRGLWVGSGTWVLFLLLSDAWLRPSCVKGLCFSGGVIYFAFPAMPPEQEVRRPKLCEFIESLVGGPLMLISCRLVAVVRAIVKLEGPGPPEPSKDRNSFRIQRPGTLNPKPYKPYKP